MSDLTDEELSELARNAEHLPSSPITLREIEPLLDEIGRRRAAQTADADRVRAVVREAAIALLIEREMYIVKPQRPTMNEIVLEAYGHGRACDAVALLGDDLKAVLADLADRVAAQLTAPAAGTPV